MASIGSLEVSLSMNASNFNGTVAQVNRNMKAMSSELQALKAKGSDYEKSISGMSQKQDILARSFDAAGIKLQEQRRRYDELVASGTATEAQIERQANAVNQAQAQYNRLERELAEVTEQLRVQSSQWTQAGQRMQEVGNKLTVVGNSMKQIGQNMSMYVTAPLVAMGAGIVKVGMDFDSQMSKVSAVSGATGSDFDALRAKAEELGASTKFSATQVAEGMEYLALAGFKTNQILGATEGLLDLAAAAGMDLGMAADITTDVMSAFGMQAKESGHAADVFAYAQANANTNVEQMGEAMKYVAPMANQMGWSLEETSAAMMKLADNGLKGSIAGQAFASSLGRLAKPTKAMRKTMDELGLSFFDANDNMKSLPDIVGHLEDKFDGLTMKQKSAAITTLFGAEAYKHWAILLESGSDILKTHTKSLENADGTAKRMADTMNDNLAGSVLMLKSALEGLAIQFSDLIKDDIRAFADWLTKMTGKFAELDESTKKTILVVGGLVAAIGPLVLIGGALISSTGTIITAMGSLALSLGIAGGATTAFGAVLAVVTGPIGLTVAALSLLGIGAAVVVKEVSKASLEVESFKDSVSESTAEAVGSFLELSDNATVALNQLAWSGVEVTTGMATKIIEIYNQMGQQVITEMQADHAEQLATMQQHFANSSALTETEETSIIALMQTKQSEKETVITDGNARIAEILNTAASEKRSITEVEQQEINAIQKTMTENAIVYMSENEREQKVIFENLKNEVSKITAEQAAEVVKNSVKQKDEVVKEATDQYDKVVGEIIKQRDEMGTISEEQARKLIEEAKKQRDETIKNAEEMHDKVVTEAKDQAEEHVEQVDWETGEILSKWEAFKNNSKKKFSEIKNDVSEKWGEIKQDTVAKWEEIKDWAGKKIDEMKTSVEKKMGEVKLKIEKKWTEAETFLSSIDLKAIGKDIVQGLINGINDKIDGVVKAAKNIGQKVIDSVSNVLQRRSPSRVMIAIGKDTGEGLAIGIEDKKDRVTNAMADVAKGIIEVKKKYSDEEKKFIEKSNADIAKIEKRLGEDLAKIKRTAAAANRQLTTDENIKMQRLIEDAAKKTQDIEDKVAKSSTDKMKKAQKERFDAIKLHIDDKKSLDQLSVKDEAGIWKQATEQFAAGTKERVQSQQNYKKAIEAINKEDLESIKQYIADKKSMEELSLVEEASIWERTTLLFEEGTKERIEAQKAYQTSVQAINKELTATNADYSQQIIKINEDLIKSEEALNKAYEDAVSKRQGSLVNFKGTFDEFKFEIDRTGEQLMTNLRSQVSAFEEWQRQIDMLSDKAINKGLLAELKEMGPNALPELISLNSMTDKQLTEYSDLYAKKSKLAREQAEKELKGMKDDTDKQIRGLRKVANDQLGKLQKEWNQKIKSITQTTSTELSSLEQVGRDAGQGLLDGLSSMEGELNRKARQIANSIKNTIQSALDIHSPSRVMRGFGVNIGQGLVLGMDDMVNKVSGAAQRLASSVEGGVNFGGARSSSINNSRSYSGQTTINVYGNNLSPSEIARRNTQAQRQQAMEWGMA